jgi:hypothetical protein
MVKKKGQQQMTLGTLIGIVLGIALLVFLIWGFSVGWGNFWEQITGNTRGANVQLRIDDCVNDCDAGEQTAWENEKKELRYVDTSGKVVKVDGTCKQFVEGGKIDGKDVPKLGFQECTFP